MAELWSLVKIRKKCAFLSFFKIDLCSVVSFKRSRRKLSIDVAEHRSILGNKGRVRVFWSFVKIDLQGSAISFKRYRGELPIDEVERRS